MPSPTGSIEWFRYPFVAAHDLAKEWLTTETLLGLAPNTLDAYARALNDFLQFCQKADILPTTATRADLARYVGDLRSRSRPAPHQDTPALTPSVGLSNATLQQRLTAVRLFFDFLIEEGQRTDHPVGRGKYTPGKAFGADRERALVPRFQTMPWLPFRCCEKRSRRGSQTEVLIYGKLCHRYTSHLSYTDRRLYEREEDFQMYSPRLNGKICYSEAMSRPE